MFDKLKKLKELKNLRDQMSKESVTVEKEGVSVVVNGQMEVEKIEVEGEADLDVVRECVNEGMKKMQKKVASFLN